MVAAGARVLLAAVLAVAHAGCESPRSAADAATADAAAAGDAGVSWCIPVLDHRNSNPSAVVNLVFVAINFPDLAAATEAARFHLSEALAGGLFHWEPFRSNEVLFDAWLVPEVATVEDVGPYGVNLAPVVDRLHPLCDLPNKQVIALSATHIGASAGPGEVRMPHHPEWAWSPLSHEFGHAFGSLVDE